MLIDAHTHVFYKDFEKDLPEVMGRCKDFYAIINNGLEKESNRKVVALSKKYKALKPALGMYPTEADKISDEDLEVEIAFIRKEKPIAIGEIGLDLKLIDNLERQKEVFLRMLELAKKMKLPVIVHSRKAEKEVVETMEEMQVKKAVMHCYTGNLKLAKRILDNGWLFSIPPIINHSQQFQQLVEIVPSSLLLTETDAPYLSHERGQRNEPINVIVALENISRIKQLDIEEVKKIIFQNYRRVFEY